MKQRFLLPLLSPLALVLASCGTPAVGDSASPDPVALADAPFTVTELGKFNEPWAVAFLPGTDQALVTEKSGRLMLWQQGKANRVVAGAPKVDYGGQGGFGDVVLSPRFTSDGLVYLSWAEAGADDMRGAAVGRGKLVIGADGTAGIEGLSVIWRQTPKVKGRGHYSHRILFSPDGKQLFITSGDRQKMTPAQDMSGNLGKIVRLMPDGSVPADNPWAASGGVTSQIWSFGHRNVLGLQFDADGRLWDLEHGPAGGDELNLVKPGSNYGWPLVSNGDHYDGRVIPRHSTRPDLAAPAISWNPVIAPGHFIFYKGNLFPDWRGEAIIAALGAQSLVRVRIEGDKAREIVRYNMDARIRAVAEREDGSIWVLEDGEGGRLLKLSPKTQ